MIHARDDYNRIQDPAVQDPSLLAPGTTAIQPDEPVFLIRGRDKLGPDVLRVYADDLEDEPGHDPRICEMVREQANVMERYQEAIGVRKLPDLPTEVGTSNR